jgi:hypothetical protein
MGFWGNTSQQTPQQPKKFANINNDQINSNQQAVPVKYLAGRFLVAGDYISPAYNPVAKAVKTTTGKNQTSTTGYKYYADFALMFCTGGRNPVDAVYRVVVDSDIRWTGNVTRTGADYQSITVQGLGTFNLYWGTETQAIDATLLSPRGIAGLGVDPTDATTWPENPATGGAPVYQNKAAGDPNPFSGHYDKHPAYRGQCYAVFKSWFLGRDRTTVQNIQLELKRGCPWFGGSFVASDDLGVNPIAVLYDWLTDTRFGMGLADSQLNQTAFQAAFNALESQSQPARISPMISSQMDFRQAIAQLLEYYDGWIRRNGTLIEAGLWQSGTNVISVATLTDDDLLADPGLDPQGWGPTFNEVTVVYKDRQHYFNDYVQTFRDPTNFRIVGGPRATVLERYFITDANLAKTYAKLAGQQLSMPFTQGTLTVKREWLTNNSILPGVVFTYTSTFYGLSFLMRLYEIEYQADKDAAATLTVEWERGKWPGIYLPQGLQGPGGFVTGPRAIWQSFMTEVPYLLADHAFQTQLVPFAVRGDVTVQGFRIWISFDGGSTYQIVPNSSSTSQFGSMGLVQTSVGASDTVIACNLYGIDLDDVVSQTDAAQQDDTLLLIMGGEFMSVGQVTALGSGLYNVSVLRGRYGTTASTYGVGTFMGFIYRDRLRLLDNVQFVPGNVIYYKFQPFTADTDYDLTQITPVAYTIIGFVSVPTPVTSPPPTGFVTSITISLSAVPAGFVPYYTLDGTPVDGFAPIWPSNGAGTITLTATTLVRVRFIAPTGQSSQELAAQYTLATGTAPQTQCGAPTWSFSGTLNATGGNITLTPTTAGSSISYKVNGGSTLSYSAPVHLAKNDVIEFWAVKATLLDSQHIIVDNTYAPGYGGTGGGKYPQ